MNPKKLYVFDAKGGQAYASVDGGAHFTAAPTGLPGLGDYQYSSASVHATPGIEGDVWLTAFKELDHSTDSGKSYEAIPSVGEAYALGFGKPAEGKTYPALYLIGKIGDVTGFFRSDDKGESLGAHQRRHAPVGLLHRHHRRPARLGPGLHRDRRARHHLRRAEVGKIACSRRARRAPGPLM